MEVDHVKPVTDGGEELDLVNLQTLCVRCHIEKTREENRTRAEEHMGPARLRWRAAVRQLSGVIDNVRKPLGS